MSKNINAPAKDKWSFSKSRVSLDFNKIKGFEGWFYTGGTLHFGHPNAKKKKGKS
jgi:hypothetical protein